MGPEGDCGADAVEGPFTLGTMLHMRHVHFPPGGGGDVHASWATGSFAISMRAKSELVQNE
jgi:hypothetical protein